MNVRHAQHASLERDARTMVTSPPPPVHVLSDRGGRWSVYHEGDERPLSEHGSATEAEGAARALAPEVIVHDRYGRIRNARMTDR
jgi:hypothetical protein